MRHRDVAHRAGRALAGLAAAGWLAACGGTGSLTSATVPEPDPEPPVTAAAPASTSPVATTAPSPAAPTSSASEPIVETAVTTAPAPVTAGSVIATPAPGHDGITDVPGNPDLDEWHESAAEHRDAVGSSFRYTCPPTASADGFAVWGVGVYTDDSSVCAAAVLAGLIAASDGGTVLITMTPGEDSYAGGTANGVTSEPYGSWPASFFFPAAAPVSESADLGPDSWQTTVLSLGVGVGYTGTLECSPGGVPGEVWGTGVYTGNSSICTAAVHFGMITVESGGSVAFDVLGVQPEFVGTVARGISSGDHDSFGPALQFSD